MTHTAIKTATITAEDTNKAGTITKVANTQIVITTVESISTVVAMRLTEIVVRTIPRHKLTVWTIAAEITIARMIGGN